MTSNDEHERASQIPCVMQVHALQQEIQQLAQQLENDAAGHMVEIEAVLHAERQLSDQHVRSGFATLTCQHIT